MYTANRRRPGLNPRFVIGLIIAATALLFIGAAVLIVFNPFAPAAEPLVAPMPQPDLDVPTAREAYPAAVEMARTQDAGAQLMSAAGGWTPTIKLDNLNTGRTSWTFHFYLPSSQTVIWVAVARGNSAQIAQVLPWDTPPPVLDDQGWVVDSAQAVDLALQRCRGALNDDPQASVEARLSLSAAGRAILWHVSVLPSDPEEEPCEADIDATLGVVR